MLPLSGERINAKGIISEKLDSVDTLRGSSTLKRGFAHMQKNGVVMDVTNVEQALIAQEAGAVSVMVLDKLPSEVRKAGGVARTASIKIIEEIMDSVTIPVMAKCRIGHVNEALVLQETDVDMIDECVAPVDLPGSVSIVHGMDHTPCLVNVGTYTYGMRTTYVVVCIPWCQWPVGM